jgi:hypothetical protein
LRGVSSLCFHFFYLLLQLFSSQLVQFLGDVFIQAMALERLVA